ncbi:MAG: glycosyltransferase family 2 protein [Clostridiaceae bacterium]|nr:glycosyltransferase family 2 protein [Clostridiaceae bacterium]
MKTPLVSIIIPIYNAERTIERCLVSIRNQTYGNFEVLMVNDGSTDHTMQILEKYKGLDKRFKIINKKNSGVSESRNRGISRARGTYLQFVDADDWLAKDATETFVEAAEMSGCDMVISDFNRVIGRRIYIKGHIKEEGPISRETFAEYMMDAPANFYYGVMWNKFFRTDVVRKKHIKCSDRLDWCEDFLFNLEYLQFVDSVYVVKKPLYYYVKTKGSLVNRQFGLKKMIEVKRILFVYYKELYQQIDLYRENRVRIRLFYLSVARDRGVRKKTA